MVEITEGVDRRRDVIVNGHVRLRDQLQVEIVRRRGRAEPA